MTIRSELEQSQPPVPTGRTHLKVDQHLMNVTPTGRCRRQSPESVLEHVTVPIADLPPAFDGFRIAQLTDLHVQPGFPRERLRPAIELAMAERPDLIALTGDYVYDKAGHLYQYLEEVAATLSVLKAPYGTFAIFGNHDFPEPPADPPDAPWRAAGIRVLNDAVAEIKRGGTSLFLVGLRSFIKRPVDVAATLRLAPPDAVRIVLWHEPDRAHECAEAGASLQLSGHTHGGQVVLPVLGPPVLPPGGRIYPAGLNRVGEMPLYVSRGVGVLPPRLRLNCPPEVTLLTLARRASA